MALSSTEPLVARILMATAVVPNPSQAINSNESKSKHATDRMGVSAVTSSKEDTVGGRSEQCDGGHGSGGSGKNAGVSSSVKALNNHADALDSSEGMPTECSPVEEFNGEEEVFKRAKSTRMGRAARPGRGGRRAPPKEVPAGAAGGVDGTAEKAVRARKAEPSVGRRVRVFWDGEEAWFEGMVDHVDEANALMYVVYDDGDEAWEAYNNVLWSLVDGGGVLESSDGARRVEPARTTSVADPKAAAAAAATAATERKRKSLSGVDEHLRAQIGLNTSITTPRHARVAAASGGANGAADNTPNGAGLFSMASAPKMISKRNKRLQALIGAHRRQSDLESPQPGNIANHARRAMESAKDTPNSGLGNLGTHKGPVAKTALARRTAAVSKPPAVAPKLPAVAPKPPAVAPKPPAAPKPARKAGLQPASRAAKKRVTLGDMHDLSSYPSDDDGDLLINEQTDATFTARDAGDDADIFALDALNEAIVRAVDSQSTLANKISHQKLSLLKLEMKHALEEAHNSAKNKLSEVTHTSRVNCTNAINTLNSKISEMEMFMQQQQVTFNSMQQQCQALRKTAEHTIQNSERKIHSLHDAEMGSLEKLHKALYDTYTDGVAYIKNYSERMTVGGPGSVRIRDRIKSF